RSRPLSQQALGWRRRDLDDALASSAIGVGPRTVWHLVTSARVRQRDVDPKHLFHRQERNLLFATSLRPDRIAHRFSVLWLRSCPVSCGPPAGAWSASYVCSSSAWGKSSTYAWIVASTFS